LSSEDETILRQSTDAYLHWGEKPKYKDLTAVGEKDIGNFILTNKRILFLRKTTIERILGSGAVGLVGAISILAGLPAGLVITEHIEGKIQSARVKPEEVSKILQDEKSLSIPLEDIIEVKAKRAFFVTAYLMVKYNTPEGSNFCSFVFGTAAKGQKDLADAIMAAKKGENK
jgi:hypothetical protein